MLLHTCIIGPTFRKNLLTTFVKKECFSLICMKLTMSFKITSARKTFGAHITNEWRFICVRSNMYFEITFVGKSFGTQTADEWLFISMNA